MIVTNADIGLQVRCNYNILNTTVSNGLELDVSSSVTLYNPVLNLQILVANLDDQRSATQVHSGTVGCGRSDSGDESH